MTDDPQDPGLGRRVATASTLAGLGFICCSGAAVVLSESAVRILLFVIFGAGALLCFWVGLSVIGSNR